jgi:hypothetical protein
VNRTTAVALPFVASAAATALAVGVPVGIAHSQELRDTAKPPGLVVDQHARVILSALPKCQQEDGPNPEACVWNVGPQFTRRDGLSLYYRRAGVNDLTRDGRDFRPHYVWNRDPVAGHPHNHWLTRAQREEFRAARRRQTSPAVAALLPARRINPGGGSPLLTQPVNTVNLDHRLGAGLDHLSTVNVEHPKGSHHG